MKNIWKLTTILLAALLVVGVLAMPFLGNFGYRSNMPMMRFAQPHMFNFLGFGGFGMFFGMPLFVLLLIAGGVLVARALKTPQQAAPPPPAPALPLCPQCAKPLQPDWVHCPYCGEKI